MGHIWAPLAFCYDYMMAVDSWVQEERVASTDEIALSTYDPVSGTLQDLSLTVYVDDVAKTRTVRNNDDRDQLPARVEAGRRDLQRHLQARQYCQNPDKTVHVVAMRGKGCYRANKQMQSSRSVVGTKTHEARYLGYRMSGYDSLVHELRARVVGARTAWRRGGAIWRMRIPWRAMRMLFLGLVQSAALSGMEAFVVSDTATRRLDAVLVPMLRYLSARRRRAPPEKPVRELPTVVMARWGVAPASVELRTRRLRLYQTWARQQDAHRQEVASVFGDSRIDRDRDVERMEDRRLVCDASTPWAQQYRDDMLALFGLGENEELADRFAADHLVPFRDAAMREAFLQLDLGVLRAAARTSRWAPPEWAPGGDELDGDDDRPFTCYHEMKRPTALSLCATPPFGRSGRCVPMCARRITCAPSSRRWCSPISASSA